MKRLPFNWIFSSLKIYIIVLVSILIMNCSSSLHTIHEQWDIRRNQQMTNIDSGIPAKKGSPQISFSYNYSIQEPDVQEYCDTILDDLNSKIIGINLYETRHSMNTELLFPLSDMIAAGFIIDLSLGDIANNNISKNSLLQKNIIETSLYLRFVAIHKKISFGLRPELLFYAMNSECIKRIDSTINSNKNDHSLGITLRCSIFSRYSFNNTFAIFTGVQYKRQPYAKYENERSQFESAFGIYTGLSIKPLDPLFIEPYVAIPLGTDYTNYRSPAQIGIKCVTDFSLFDK